jgi:hypothetical protein
MKFTQARPYADPEAAARKLIEIANSVEAVQVIRSSKPSPARDCHRAQ